MAVYSKICIICTDEFICRKISTVYCSKKCANRARSLPSKIMQSLIQRSQQFTLKNIVQLREKRHSETRNMTADNPLGDEHGLLVAQMKIEAEKRGIKQPKEPILPMDEEMVNFKVQSPKDTSNIGTDNFIYNEDPAAGTADGFKDTDTIVKVNGVEQPKSKLRRIGAK